MSRVYEALQKSQGESPSASPLVSGQPEAAPGEATAVAVAAGVPVGTPTDANWLKVPADRVLRPAPTPEQRLVALAEPEQYRERRCLGYWRLDWRICRTSGGCRSYSSPVPWATRASRWLLSTSL